MAASVQGASHHVVRRGGGTWSVRMTLSADVAGCGCARGPAAGAGARGVSPRRVALAALRIVATGLASGVRRPVGRAAELAAERTDRLRAVAALRAH
jgi:hypothetical protein